MIALLILCVEALAGGHVVVGAGDTVESIAAALGDPALAAAIRAQNGLGPVGEPAVGAVLTLPGALGGASQDALVLSAYGSGEVRRPGARPDALAPGLSLPAGTVLCTAEESYATVRLALDLDGRRHDDVNLLPSTCMVVEATAAAPGVRRSLISVQRGSVSVQDGRTMGAGTVTVRTRDGLTTGDAGGFRVHVEGAATRTEALYSAVSMLGGGAEVQVGAGQGSRVRQGQAPDAPIALLPPGEQIAPEDGERLRVPEFSWTPVERALGYRVEIALTPSFNDTVLVEESASPVWAPEYLMLPFRVPGLWWRVASIDRTGFIGVPSDPRRLDFPAGVGP